MKEPIQQSGHEVSIVIYDAPLPPRYLRFSKKFFRTLFVVVPIFLGLIFLGLLFWGLGSRIKDAPKPTLPTVLSDQDAKILALESEIKNLQESNVALQEKISSPVIPGTQEDPYLMVIKKPYGMQNLLVEKKVSLDQFEFLQDQNKTTLKFQIISSNETKVTGHVLVFMISEGGMMAWPKEANAALAQGVKYSMGDTFAVSRLRPTDANFFFKPEGKFVKFIVYIFTREGDLLLVKETESFQIGAKS